jgi:hypothetical protein
MLRKVSDLRDLCLQVARLNPARKQALSATNHSIHPAAIAREERSWPTDPAVNEDQPG